MPKIDAPTVVEHHSRRRAALIDAGIDLVAEEGLDGLSLAAVGAATGLARSSVYQYFGSTPALIAAVVEGAFPVAIDRLRAAVERAETSAAKVDAYLGTAIDLAGDRTHRAMHALAGVELPAACRARLIELHQEQYAPLRDAVTALDPADPELTTRLLIGIVRAAAQAIVDGAPAAAVKGRALALVHHGLGD